MNDCKDGRLAAIEYKIEETVRRYGMLSGNCRVVAGVSGGADSMALVHFLYRRGTSVLAAHVNHGLRGEESQRDENFVRQWCQKNGVPFRVLNVDIRRQAQERGEGLEECGRRVRYDFFSSLVEDDGKIATAHTLSDCAETVLFHLARGTGTKGLCGIPPVRGKIIRPLIEITREEIEAYCAGYDLPFVQDSTNFMRDYNRNRIRLDVVPVLRQINPSFEAALLRMSRQLEEEDRYLDSLAKTALQTSWDDYGGYRVSMLKGLPSPVLARVVIQAVSLAQGGMLESSHILAGESLLRAGHGAVTVAGGIQLRIENGLLFVIKEKCEKPGWSIPLTLPKTLTEDGRTLIIECVSREEYENRKKFNNLLFNNAVSYDTIINNTFVRTRREGDCFRPVGRGLTKSLKKLFNEIKIPPCRRGGLMLLESGGRILWIEGVGPSEEGRVRGGGQVALLSIKECKS